MRAKRAGFSFYGHYAAEHGSGKFTDDRCDDGTDHNGTDNNIGKKGNDNESSDTDDLCNKKRGNNKGGDVLC